MGQGRSEGHATADRFVYLACLWYPAFPPPRPSSALPTAWPGSDHAVMDQGHFSPESQHSQPQSPLRPTQNTWASVGLLPHFDKNNNWLICTRIVVLSFRYCRGGFNQINMTDIHAKHTRKVKVMVLKNCWWFATQGSNVFKLPKLFLVVAREKGPPQRSETSKTGQISTFLHPVCVRSGLLMSEVGQSW